MIIQTIHCDICGKELPREIVNILGQNIEVYKTAHCKEWDLKSILPHICKTCALEIDNKLLKLKLELMK